MEKWEQPLYSYVVGKSKRKILVNVTRSCPVFTKPAPAIDDMAAELKRQGMLNVLDFGAGKLRNTLYLLPRGFKVCAVEFNDCFQTPAGRKSLAKAKKRYKRSFRLVLPHAFLKQESEVDAVFLVNVANVVPDETDRRIIVNECTKRLRPGGWFLWMTHKDEPHYQPAATKRASAPDGGYFYGLEKTQQVYNRSFTIPQIRAYFSNKKYREPQPLQAKHHIALIFEKR